MGATPTIMLVAAGGAAAVNWIAVANRRRRLEKLTKPLVMLLLIGVAVTVEAATPAVRLWFVAALILSLAGDVFLMLDTDRFIAGLASFLGAHVAYGIGYITAGAAAVPGAIGLACVAVPAILVGGRIRSSAASHDRRLGAPVTAYIAVIAAMVVLAAATGNAVAILGAILFFVSDAVLGWDRFVAALPGGRLTTMVTYHAAQALLVIALLTLE